MTKIFHQRSKQAQEEKGRMFGKANTFAASVREQGRYVSSKRAVERELGIYVGGKGIREHIARRLLCATSRRAGGVNDGTKGVYGEL